MKPFLALVLVCCVAESLASPVFFPGEANVPKRIHFGVSNHIPASRRIPRPATTPEHPPTELDSLGKRDITKGISITFRGAHSRPSAPVVMNPFDEESVTNTRIFFPGDGPSVVEPDNPTSSGDGGSGDREEPVSSGDSGWVHPDVNGPRSELNTEPDPGSCLSANLTVHYNGTTWTLLARNECGPEEWAVVVEEECRPSCQPRPCPKGQFEYQGECVDPTDPSVCGEGQILYVHKTGKTFCDCEQNYFFNPRRGTCFARGEKGFCGFGEVVDVTKSGDVICVPNQCQANGFLMHATSGQCFEKVFAGYCPDIMLLFHHNNLTVDCNYLDLRNILDRPISSSCRDGSRLNHLMRCTQELVIPSVSTYPRSLSGGCSSGYRRDARGTCRRVNRFFA